MLPARSPLRESKTFFAYSHHRALLTTLLTQFFLGTVRLILLSLSGFLVPLGSCSVAMVTGLQLESQSPIIVSFFFFFINASGTSSHKLGVFIDRKRMRDGNAHGSESDKMNLHEIVWLRAGMVSRV